jgi:4-azaleucine resistance transporter AzlC
MQSSRPPFTIAGCLQGLRYTIPILPGIVFFAVVFGAAAVQKGLTLGQALGMSTFVFAGAAQMVALELWQLPFSPTGLVGITALTAVINARMVLMGAVIQPWLAPEPGPRRALNLFFLTDANWLIGMRYHGEGGRDIGILFGSGLTLWVAWIVATLPGYFAGGLVPEPRRFGLDLVMPIFFSAMLVPLWKGWRPAFPWLIAGAVALVVHALVPGYAFIIVGALAGAAAGALLE